MACLAGYGSMSAARPRHPAVGRGPAELVAHCRFRTLDLSPLAYDRYLRGIRLTEANVI